MPLSVLSLRAGGGRERVLPRRSHTCCGFVRCDTYTHGCREKASLSAMNVHLSWLDAPPGKYRGGAGDLPTLRRTLPQMQPRASRGVVII